MISQGPAYSSGKGGAAFVRTACQHALCVALPQSRLIRQLLLPAPTHLGQGGHHQEGHIHWHLLGGGQRGRQTGQCKLVGTAG